MRVTLDVDALSPRLSGIGRYVWELCSGLARRRDLRVQYYARGQLVSDPALLLRCEQPRRRFRRLRRLLPELKPRYGLFHGPNYFLPDHVESGAITVHDLSVLRYPESHPAARVAAFERNFERSLGRATHILTDTETVRNEIMEAFGVPQERITAVLLGVDPSFRPRLRSDLEPLLSRRGLEPGRYCLCVSTLEPRKRIADLLVAWSRLDRDLRSRYTLVLAGDSGWLNDELLVAIDAGVRDGWLNHLGFVDEAELPVLYAGAALCLYPSIYEGFGLPPLEAMASGVPVIVANRSCLPEVTAGAAMEIDPDDDEAFVEAIKRALSDEDWRASARRRGLERAAELCWRRCVDHTVSVYRQICSK